MLRDPPRNRNRETAPIIMRWFAARFRINRQYRMDGNGSRVNLSLSKPWRRALRSARYSRNRRRCRMDEALQAAMTPDVVESLFALAFGFAVAGLCASGYRVFGLHFPSFRLLEVGPMAARFAAVPLLIFSAPFLIMRNTLRGRRLERRRAELVMMATVIAGLWSLMSGTVLVMALQALLGA